MKADKRGRARTQKIKRRKYKRAWRWQFKKINGGIERKKGRKKEQWMGQMEEEK